VVGCPAASPTCSSTSSKRPDRFLINYLKPVAFAQADPYGHFFRREKEVQIHIVEEDKTETWEENTDKKGAIKAPSSFEKADRKEKPSTNKTEM